MMRRRRARRSYGRRRSTRRGRSGRRGPLRIGFRM